MAQPDNSSAIDSAGGGHLLGRIAHSQTLGLVAIAAPAIAIVVAVFGSGLRAWFVSDAWIFLQRARLPVHTLLQHLVPSNEGFYRPIVEITFWVEQRLFGMHALPYHLVALAAHAGSSVLLGAIIWRLTRSLPAAIAGVVAFVFSIHAHEVVFDIADLHNAIGGLFFFGALLAFMRGHTVAPAVLTVLLFLVDETGLLILPLAGLYLLIFERRMAVRRLVPLALITGGYVAWRFTGGGFGNEVTDQCASVECVLAGSGQYFNRLFLRPDLFITRDAPTAAIIAIIVGLTLWTAPWRWRHARTALFGVGWFVGLSLFFLLALWPYIADRFLYLPSAGVAIAVGVVAAEALQRAREGFTRAVAGGIVVGALAVWIAAGAMTLNARGALWNGAGVRASWIVAQVLALHPEPPTDATLSFRGVPPLYRPVIPPGNTGAFVFHNGLPEALAYAYGRDDLVVVEDLGTDRVVTDPSVLHIVIYTSGHVMEDPEYVTDVP